MYELDVGTNFYKTGERVMYYVNPSEVMRLFRTYLKEYKGMITTETAIEELQDALDSAECEWIDKDGE